MDRIINILEENADVIIEEYKELKELSDNSLLTYWPETTLYTGSWLTLPLIHFSNRFEENLKLYKNTNRVLELIQEDKEIVTAGFSVLKGRTVIKPHVGYNNGVIRYHLGLIIPKDINKDINKDNTCELQVENTIYKWEEGEAFKFDDTKLHSACNNTSSDRVILLIDIKI